MNIYLTWDDEKHLLLLPINPESFEISGSQNNTSLYIHNLGEINLKGKRGLYSITLESFFPATKYSFRHGAYHEPYDYYCKKLKKLFENNTTLHLIITGTDINMFCTIENFNHGESDGSGDVKYSLTLKEYRDVLTSKRMCVRKIEKTYKWKKGDTWPKVVKKHLGSSKGWKKIRKSNMAVVNTAKWKHPGKKETVALIGSKVVINDKTFMQQTTTGIRKS